VNPGLSRSAGALAASSADMMIVIFLRQSTLMAPFWPLAQKEPIALPAMLSIKHECKVSAYSCQIFWQSAGCRGVHRKATDAALPRFMDWSDLAILLLHLR
jgi:hypothetical protein